MLPDNQQDYGNEDYDPNLVGGNPDNNQDGNNNNEGDQDFQDFEDAGDIGYLPADHVTSPSPLL